MSNWTTADIVTIAHRRASKANAGRVASSAEPESSVPNEPVAETKRENQNTERYAVHVRSFRCRLCDPDNLCPKYFIDSLRYASLLPDDRPEVIELTVSQEKVSRKEFERTEIEITRL